jgi:hypothetical protein
MESGRPSRHLRLCVVREFAGNRLGNVSQIRAYEQLVPVMVVSTSLPEAPGPSAEPQSVEPAVAEKGVAA